MSSSPYQETCVNALLCYFVLGYAEKNKRRFTKIMSLPLNQAVEEEGKFISEINIYKGGGRCCDIIEDELLSHSNDSE